MAELDAALGTAVDFIAGKPGQAVAAGSARAIGLDPRQARHVVADADDDRGVWVQETAEDLEVDHAAHPVVEAGVHVHDEEEAEEADGDGDERADAPAIPDREVPDGQGIDDEQKQESLQRHAGRCRPVFESTSRVAAGRPNSGSSSGRR
jgi:hypothetical protein